MKYLITAANIAGLLNVAVDGVPHLAIYMGLRLPKDPANVKLDITRVGDSGQQVKLPPAVTLHIQKHFWCMFDTPYAMRSLLLAVTSPFEIEVPEEILS